MAHFGTTLHRLRKRDDEYERTIRDAPVSEQLVEGVLTDEKRRLAETMRSAGSHPVSIANALHVPLRVLRPVLWPEPKDTPEEAPEATGLEAAGDQERWLREMGVL